MKALSARSLLLLLTLILGTKSALAGIIIQENWRYTTANANHSSDASASFQPLDFTNTLTSTSATAAGFARANEDLTGGNSASVNLVYSFDFLVDRETLIGLSDRLIGALFLGDTDNAHVDTFVEIYNQQTNKVVASLPVRSHTRSGTPGSETFDESTPFSLHYFRFLPGDYLLRAGLNMTANATRGFGDDRMESNFSYTAAMSVPEPSTWSLMIFGGLGLLIPLGFRHKVLVCGAHRLG